MEKLNIKKDDTVVVISGDDKGKQGKVIAAAPKEGKVIVEKVNVVKKHVKPRKMGEQGGIIEAEAALYACKVQLVCPKCGKPTRVGHVVENGKKMRACKNENCGAHFE